MNLEKGEPNTPDKDKPPNITAQAVLYHPTAPTTIWMIHDLGDRELSCNPEILEFYGHTRKPPGLANPGGGLERGETVIQGIRREIQGETGFLDFEIVPLDSTRLDLLRYRHKGGHQVLMLEAHLRSLQQGKILEPEETDGGWWFDLAESLISQLMECPEKFSKDLFYWSHIRRLLLAVSQRDRQLRYDGSAGACIGHLVHPSGRLVFQVGVGDTRFPKAGFRIPSQTKKPKKDWYDFLRWLIENKIVDPDPDVVYQFFTEDIIMAKNAEELIEGTAASIELKLKSVEETNPEKGTKEETDAGDNEEEPDILRWQDAIIEARDFARTCAEEDERWKKWAEANARSD
ncbi:MAG: NUDIX domain-containing protein [Candidatus Sungiibacteriota bacterium]|uniref:NUDIX domain-containing protein n=1 Tax=Candidatus Sungiibacteriota bacterium TaxID=2750080 RepID=A0A7T5RK26_9BACT|nr:MAG: NUDIX domain-containing protein [Candidatus Sungbacteria bacterium]